jgi:hypothetical protein
MQIRQARTRPRYSGAQPVRRLEAAQRDHFNLASAGTLACTLLGLFAIVRYLDPLSVAQRNHGFLMRFALRKLNLI